MIPFAVAEKQLRVIVEAHLFAAVEHGAHDRLLPLFPGCRDDGEHVIDLPADRRILLPPRQLPRHRVHPDNNAVAIRHDHGISDRIEDQPEVVGKPGHAGIRLVQLRHIRRNPHDRLAPENLPGQTQQLQLQISAEYAVFEPGRRTGAEHLGQRPFNLPQKLERQFRQPLRPPGRKDRVPGLVEQNPPPAVHHADMDRQSGEQRIHLFPAPVPLHREKQISGQRNQHNRDTGRTLLIPRLPARTGPVDERGLRRQLSRRQLQLRQGVPVHDRLRTAPENREFTGPLSAQNPGSERRRLPSVRAAPQQNPAGGAVAESRVEQSEHRPAGRGDDLFPHELFRNGRLRQDAPPAGQDHEGLLRQLPELPEHLFRSHERAVQEHNSGTAEILRLRGEFPIKRLALRRPGRDDRDLLRPGQQRQAETHIVHQAAGQLHARHIRILNPLRAVEIHIAAENDLRLPRNLRMARHDQLRRRVSLRDDDIVLSSPHGFQQILTVLPPHGKLRIAQNPELCDVDLRPGVPAADAVEKPVEHLFRPEGGAVGGSDVENPLPDGDLLRRPRFPRKQAAKQQKQQERGRSRTSPPHAGIICSAERHESLSSAHPGLWVSAGRR